jgi:hypothetical protein
MHLKQTVTWGRCLKEGGRAIDIQSSALWAIIRQEKKIARTLLTGFWQSDDENKCRENGK